MARAKPVTINGRYFPKKGDALSYFMDKRPEIKEGGAVSEGVFFEELKDLFTRYCEYSPGYELNGREIIAFIVKNERRTNQGLWFETVCYKVQFSNDEIRPFSIKEALTVIINNES